MVQGCGRPADVKNIKTLWLLLTKPIRVCQCPQHCERRAPRRAAGGDLLPLGRQGASCQFTAVKSHRGIYGALFSNYSQSKV